MNKAYERVNWQNAPSEATALNETNLNKMDAGIDEIDDRVVAIDGQLTNDEYAITQLQDGKVDKINGKGLCDIQEFDTLWGSVNTGAWIGRISYKTQGGSTVVRQIYNGVEVDSALSDSSTHPVQNKVVKAAVDDKVDKVAGKGLSANDYTDTDKAIVDGVAAALDGKVDKVSGKGLCAKSDVAVVPASDEIGEVIATIFLENQDNTSIQWDIYNQVEAISNAEIDALE